MEEKCARERACKEEEKRRCKQKMTENEALRNQNERKQAIRVSADERREALRKEKTVGTVHEQGTNTSLTTNYLK